MTEPRQIAPVTFLRGGESPVTRPDSGSLHPSGGKPTAEVLSFGDYYQAREGVQAQEPTEEQLSFRRYVQGGGIKTADPVEPDAPLTADTFPDADIPEV